MPENLLLRTQSNDIFQAISVIGLQPGDFSLLTGDSFEVPDLKVSKLVHTHTGYFYLFDFNSHNKHVCAFSPGYDNNVDVQYPGNWTFQLNNFRQWLGYLKREIEAPDLWESVLQEKELAQATVDADDSNQAFTPDEVKRIDTGINEIKQYLITTQSLNSAQLAFVDVRLGYLCAASERIGKKDWLILFLGGLLSIMIGISLEASQAREILRMAASALSWLVHKQPLFPQ
jgi:hypothetical protein